MHLERKLFPLTRHPQRGTQALVLAITLAGALGRAEAQVPGRQPPPPPPPGATFSRPVPADTERHLVGPPNLAATVNGQPITKATVSALALQVAGPDLLEQLVNNALVDQAAKAAHITTTPAEVNARFLQVKQQLAAQQRAQGLPVQSLQTLIAQSHQTLTTFKESLRLRIEAEKLVARQIAPMKMVHASHILVVTNGTINPSLKAHSDADALKIIGRAQADLKAGKSWADVCKKYSEDPSNKDKGGDLGVIGTGMTNIDPTFLAAAVALSSGQISPTPVKSIYGYHLIKVDSTNAAPASPAERAQYASVLATARESQYKAIIPPYLQQLRAQAKINNYLTP